MLRVGIDKGYGFLSPVFKDLTFRYIPIYYKNKVEEEKKEKRDYFLLSKEQKNNLVDYVPAKYKRKIVHYDPEFETFTYGEPTNPKLGALSKLEKGDLLVFYMGGELHSGKSKPEMGCFIFGYFEVEKVFLWDKNGDNAIIKKECKNNAHVRSSKTIDKLVIVKGSKKSRLLDKCIYFTQPNPHINPPYITKADFIKKYGIRKNVVRATPLTITSKEYIRNILTLLEI